MKELWTARIEMLTPPAEFGDTRCFTNAFVWAENPEDFARSITCHLGIEFISVLDIEDCHRVSDDEQFPEETQPFVEWIRKNPDEFTTADRHYYPSKPA